MGITGLLKSLQFCSQKRHIRDFSNQSLAVDTSSWLHKSVYSISERYVEALDRGQLDSTSVQVATKYIVGRCQELLLNAHIGRIYLVLDGKRCPLKAQTNQDREERRQKNLADARNYMKVGRRDKAEEKYKACIKISSAMANAVAEAVTRRFANDGRVQCIYSPYEADAQLVKLCMDRVAHAVVTEDSDVLVYSAACHFSFPIIYKLDKETGTCDVISMEWLLNPDAQQPWSNGGALESVLKSLASRQSRRPGVGTRLFVQACVLAGCDYCPSKLNGVGLVTAFKLVRDNAHREPGDRFRKVLSSLSKKSRANIHVEDYEALLTMSEAVFYYHPVLDTENKSVIPLMAPRTCEGTNTSSELNVTSDHHPSLHRFQGDWSFLGDMETPPHASSSYKAGNFGEKVPISEIVINHGNSRKSKAKDAQVEYDGGARAVSDIVNVVNPYTKKRKRSGSGSREPFAVIDVTKGGSQHNSSNPFSQFSHADKEIRRSKSSGLSIYVNNRQDVRFVKRKFSSGAKQPSYVDAAKKLTQKGSQLHMQTFPPNRASEHCQVQKPEFEYFASCENSSKVAHVSVFDADEAIVVPPMQDDCAQDLPFGNPDLADDVPASSKYFSLTQPTARRVTLEDKKSPLYIEFNAIHKNGSNLPQESFGEYSSTSFEDPATEVEISVACAMSKNDTYASTSSQYPSPEVKVAEPYTMPMNETFCATSFEYTEVGIVESHAMPKNKTYSSSFEHPEVEIVEACAIPRNDSTPFGNVDDRYSVSSCEDIASPDHAQSKFRPSLNNFSWAQKHSEEQQSIANPRQEQLTPVVHRQRPLATYFLGGAAVNQSSPLSVTSPAYASSTLKIHSQPAFKNQTRSRHQKSCMQSVTPKLGAITNFFPVKTPDTHGFSRF